MTSPSDGDFPSIMSDVPSPARMYDYGLGGKDNFAVDRVAAEAGLVRFPDFLVAARDNRRFLYRAVRFLARDAGIRQFLDLGSGLPTTHNVHQVAKQFQPDARVVYVDNDPVVQAHGRALLATDSSTTVIAADLLRPAEIMAHPDTLRLLDFSAPVAVLFLSVGHFIVDDDELRHVLATVRTGIAPGSFVVFTQMVGMTEQIAAESTEISRSVGITWKTRVAADVEGFFTGWEPVEPGLVDVTGWRPDPDQPPLPPVPEPLRGFEQAARAGERRLIEFGGIVRR